MTQSVAREFPGFEKFWQFPPNSIDRYQDPHWKSCLPCHQYQNNRISLNRSWITNPFRRSPGDLVLPQNCT